MRPRAPPRIAAERGESLAAVAAAVAGAGSAGIRGGRLDRAPARRDCIPCGAEVREAFSGRLARRLVTDESVERVTRVCHLSLAVGPRCQPEQGGAHALLLARLRGAEQRRPVRRTGAVTRTPAVLVLVEQIERTAPCVDENAAERRLPERDERSFRGLSRRGRAGVGEGGQRGQGQRRGSNEQYDLA